MPREELQLQERKSEPWADISYAIFTPTISPSSSKFKFPTSNPYILEKLAKKIAGEKKLPKAKLLIQEKGGKIYVAEDLSYGEKVSVYFNIYSKFAYLNGIDGNIIMDLFVMELQKNFESELFFAKQAGMKVDIKSESGKLIFQIDGRLENINHFLEKLANALEQVDLTKKLLNQLESSYQKQSSGTMLYVAFNEFKALFDKNVFSPKEKLQTLYEVPERFLRAAYDNLFLHTNVEGMIIGKINPDQVSAIWKAIKSKVLINGFEKDKEHTQSLYSFGENKGPYYLTRESGNSGNIVLLLLDHGPFNHKERVMTELLLRMIKSDFFYTLRTKQQTGYIVWNHAFQYQDRLFSLFAVQSTSHHPSRYSRWNMMRRTLLFFRTSQIFAIRESYRTFPRT